ncbi:kinase-like domain-containing protein [Phycomyces blakesleeanus]
MYTYLYICVYVLYYQTLAELMKARGRLTEPEVRYILIQILEACRYMHENRVIHRDIKLGNILLDKNLDVKVGDFGLSALLLSTEDRKRTICGTPNYIAPEILFGKEGHDYKVDIWSIGVLTYTLLVGRHPFHQSELRDIYKKIRNNSHEASYGFPSEHPISDAAKDLIARLLVNDPRIPRRIPSVALVREPTIQELFPRASLDNPNPPGKSVDLLRSAVNGTTEYCKRQSLAPLELLSEDRVSSNVHDTYRASARLPCSVSISKGGK